MNYKKIVVAGGGVLGSQIAFQTAYCGFNVTLLIREEDDKDAIVERLNGLKKTYTETVNLMNKKEDWARGIVGTSDFDNKKCLDKVNTTLDRIVIETNQKVALEDTDLLI